MQEQTDSWIREAPPAIDSKAVLQQVDRMLKSRHFRNSRRYPVFLAHIVRRTLEGDLDSLKERILGIEVFKRPHDYDTGADPVVRITAGEVRKRIALYYHDEGTEQELRIELPPGSYVPVFFVPGLGVITPEPSLSPLPASSVSPKTPTPQAEPPAVPERPGLSAQTWIIATSLLLVLGLGIGGIWFWKWISSPVEAMWRPFFGSSDPVLIVVGSPRTPDGTTVPLDSHSHVHLSFNDALALANITGLMEIHQQAYRVQTASTTSLDDLRKRPVVLISAFLNPWSARILNPLRFSLLRQQIAPDGSTMLGSIIDHRDPKLTWNFDFTKPITVNSKDYAIVARLHSDLTEAPITVIAGLGAAATESAGEFASSPDYLRQISEVAPGNWRDKNLELVLEVPMVDGKSGHAQIIASEFW
jgi:hypothetical protein